MAKVGVDLTTCSESLLKYVPGIGPAKAKKIIEYREGKLTDKPASKQKNHVNVSHSLSSLILCFAIHFANHFPSKSYNTFRNIEFDITSSFIIIAPSHE